MLESKIINQQKVSYNNFKHMCSYYLTLECLQGGQAPVVFTITFEWRSNAEDYNTTELMCKCSNSILIFVTQCRYTGIRQQTYVLLY